MDDRELGRELHTALLSAPEGTLRSECWAHVAARARSLLAKPEATREAVEKWVREIGWGNRTRSARDTVLAALSHFAPPARPKMMIEGMGFGAILGEMKECGQSFAMPRDLSEAEKMIQVVQHYCARVAHRLANTPAPEHDPDAEAKRLAWLQYDTSYPLGHARRVFTSMEDMWGNETEQWRNGWRAVAAAKKEAGGE